jgi:type I restriction enzyme S subunit
MAICNTIKLSEIRPDRFDAEYFSKSYKDNLQFLNKTGNVTTLGRLFQKVDRGEKAEYKKVGPIPVLRSVNVRSLGFNNTRQEYVTDDYFDKKPRGRVIKDDIIITSTGTGTLGRTSIWYKNTKAFNVPENSFLRGPINVDPYSIAAFLSTEFGIQQLFQHQRGSSGQLHLYPVDIRRVIVPECIFSNQKEIGDSLRFAFELYDQSRILYQQANELLEKEIGIDNSDLDNSQNKYIISINDAITGKRIDSEYYNPRTKTIVERIRALEHTITSNHFVIKNGYPWNSKKFLNDNTGEPVVRIRDIKPTYIDILDLTSLEPNYAKTVNFIKAKAGDVVVGMDGLKYFYASILEDDCFINQRVCHLVRKDGANISSEYVTFIINSKIGQSQLMRDMTIATTVGHITNVNISKLTIPVVSEDFHNKITDLVRSAIEAEKKSKILLKQAKNQVEQLIEEAANKN